VIQGILMILDVGLEKKNGLALDTKMQLVQPFN
jgi:hypothetical protein